MSAARLHAAAVALAVSLTLPASAHAAEALHGITVANELVTFHSDSPGAIRHRVPVSGLAEGDRLIAIDSRPETGQLYGLGASSRVYVLNPVSGAARAAGNPFSPLLAGSNFGFDFNPVADRIRVVSDGRQNLRLNPDDGQVAGQDNPIEYAEGDPGAGSNPSPGGAAYTPADPTQLLIIDSARDALALQDPPNQGTLKTVGPLGVDLGEPVGFDIAADNRAWVTGRRGGGATELFLIDVAKGTLSAGALRPGVGAAVIGLAAAGPVPDDTTRPSVLVAVDRVRTIKDLRRTLKVGVSCSEACGIGVTLKQGKRTLVRGGGGIGGAGRTTIALRASSRMKALAKRGKAVRAILSVSASDAAANHTRVRRSIRFG